MRKDIITVLSTQGGKWVWEKFAEEGLTPEFVAFVRELIDGDESSYSLTDLDT